MTANRPLVSGGQYTSLHAPCQVFSCCDVPTSLDLSGAKPNKRAMKPSDSSRYVASLEEALVVVVGRRAPRSSQTLGQLAARQATTTYYHYPANQPAALIQQYLPPTCSVGKGRALTQPRCMAFIGSSQKIQLLPQNSFQTEKNQNL